MKAAPTIQETSGTPFERLTTAIARWCVNHAATTIILFIAFALLSAALAATRLKIDTNPALMINRELPFRQNYQDLIKQFPALDNSFVVIIDAEVPADGRDAAGEIARQLESRTDLFSDVFAPGTGPYFDKYGVLYLEEGAVRQVADDVRDAAPLINILSLQPDLAGLADLFRQMAPVVEIGQAPPELSGFLDKIAETIQAERRGQTEPLNWMALGQEPSSLTETRWYVLVKPILDFSVLDPAARPLSEVRRVMAEFNDNGTGLKVQLTGEAALNAEEFDAVTEGAAIAGGLSLALVTLTVVIGLPSLVLAVPALALIVLGFLINAGFAALAVGTLNMISVAFAVLFIGLGIDYSVHVILRFAEERAKGANGKNAAVAAIRRISAPLGLCTLTTSLAFLAFTPTDFVGMAQLGIIAAGGIVIAFICSVTLVPAILSVLAGSEAKITQAFSKLAPQRDGWLQAHRSTVRKGATLVLIFVGIASVWFIPQVRFDGDPINLKNPAAPSMKAFNDLVNHQPARTFAVQVLTEPGEPLRRLVQELKILPQVSDVETLDSMLPPDQGSKLAHLNVLADLLPTQIEPATDFTSDEQMDHLTSWSEAVTIMADAESTTKDIRSSAARLKQALEGFIAASNSSPDAIAALQMSLVQGFPRLFAAARQMADLDRVTVDNIDAGFRQRYIAQDGRWRLEVLPKGDMQDPAQLNEFVTAILKIAPQATGAPVEIAGAANVVSFSMIKASVMSLILVLFATFAVLRRLDDVLLALAPLLLAGALLAGYTVIFNSPFNFANVIVLPLLVGLGIDSAIHYVMRAREAGAGTDVIRSWTPRAVLISGVTTMGSFGSLWLSAHRGMASMGELLAVAITITLLCTLVVLPQLISWFMRPTGQ
jgi:hopanoid biosynthesis associated RND transporter like protein HpnN